MPISAFYTDGKDRKQIQFCFTKDKATLEATAKSLGAIWNSNITYTTQNPISFKIKTKKKISKSIKLLEI